MSVPYLALPVGAAYFALELALAFVPRWFGAGVAEPGKQLVDQL
jgi:hypothetical protein